MKVLSIKEPFASLIKSKIKFIETRSWKTNYRGEIYIHVSISSWKILTERDEKLKKLLKDNTLQYGNIICKCNLVDCVYMTKEYVENIKNNNPQEYLCGDFQEGRYAWVLDNIESIEPIKAKGVLGIWNYYNEYEIMDLMKDIEYGWVDEQNNKYMKVDDSFKDKYILQSPKDILKSKVGVCWDQVELERYFFKNYVPSVKTFFIVYDDNDKCPTHTFLTFEKNNKFYWFEHSWEIFRGIHEYTSLNQLLLDIKNKFVSSELHGNYEKTNLYIYEYLKPKYHIGTQEFFNHCSSNININII